MSKDVGSENTCQKWKISLSSSVYIIEERILVQHEGTENQSVTVEQGEVHRAWIK